MGYVIRILTLFCHLAFFVRSEPMCLILRHFNRC